MQGSFFRLFSLVALVSAGFAAAQDAAAAEALSHLPKCALACLKTAVASSSCNVTDTACQCTDIAFIEASTICAAQTCTIPEQLVAKNATQTLCGAPIRDKGFEYNVISYALMGSAIAIVVIRLVFKRFFTSQDLGLDDWFILVSLIITIPNAITNIRMTSLGLGRDIWTLTPDEITDFAMQFWINAVIYFCQVFVLKLSMLFFYLRIFPARNMRRLILGTIAFDILFGLAFVMAVLFQCWPISYNWTNWRGEGGGQCADINAIAWANAAVSIMLDLWMLALPLSQLPALKLHWKKKIGVGLMFCVGTFVTVVSTIRLSSLVQFRASTNLSWDYWDVAMMSTVEIAIGIICACMPALRLILVRVLPNLLNTSTRREASNYVEIHEGGSKRSKDMSSSQKARNNDVEINMKGIHVSKTSSTTTHNRDSEAYGLPTYQVDISAPQQTPTTAFMGTRSPSLNKGSRPQWDQTN